MSIDRALARFEAVMGAAWPTWFSQLHPGLDDDGVQRLRDAVAPYLLPSQVEALYRWRNGGDQGVFGGWRMRPLDELIEWYRFTCDELDSPRTWLPVFDDQIVNIVTLDISGRPLSDPSVWYGHTHDVWLWRLFDSIEALLDVVCDAAEAGALVEQAGRLGLDQEGVPESLDGRAWSALPLSRSPGSYTWPDPPPGSELPASATPEWPPEWLLPFGVTEDSLAPRGATHTIAQLVEEATAGSVRGTIRGHVVTGSGTSGWWYPVVDDGTGQLVVACDTTVLPVRVSQGKEGEFEVVLDSADAPGAFVDEDPRVAEIVRQRWPVVPTARAIAARPLPDT